MKHRLTCADAAVQRIAPVSGRARVTVRADGATRARLHAAVLRVARAVTVALTRRAVCEVPPGGERNI